MNNAKGKHSAASATSGYANPSGYNYNYQYYQGHDQTGENDGYHDPNYYTQNYGISPATLAAQASTVVPSAFVPVSAPSTNSSNNAKQQQSKLKKTKPKSSDAKAEKKPVMRTAAGKTWEDATLQDWDDSDFRLFAGDLGNDVTDVMLRNAFKKYPSFQNARVVMDKRTQKSRGYGFISFGEADDFVKAWKDMNGKYVGNRPIKLRKSSWKDRNVEVKKKKGQKFEPYSKTR